jgi:hypothetical protein
MLNRHSSNINKMRKEHQTTSLPVLHHQVFKPVESLALKQDRESLKLQEVQVQSYAKHLGNWLVQQLLFGQCCEVSEEGSSFTVHMMI